MKCTSEATNIQQHPLNVSSTLCPDWLCKKSSLQIISISIPLKSTNSRFVDWNLLINSKSPIKQVFLVLFLIISEDIQCNPGPNVHVPRCSICKNDIEPELPSPHCQECSKWSHASCEGDIPMNQAIAGKVIFWEYPACCLPSISNSFFTMSDLELF